MQLYHPRGMGQHVIALVAMIFLALLSAGGCERSQPETRKPSKHPTVASLVPAATDLILAMDAADHLVGVSNYDVDRDGIRGLPRVGDYQTVNWETLADIRPDVLVHQVKPDRLPPGLLQRAEELNVKLLNVQIEQIEDIFRAIETLGATIEETQKANAVVERLRDQLKRVQTQVADKPKIRTLLVRDETGLAVIGRKTFVDDALSIAGGENVIAPGTHRYPNIDQEMLLSLAPDAIIQLLPDASPQVLEEARRVWTTMPDIPAVKNGRVYVLTDWFVLQPGNRIGDVAEMLAKKLHGVKP